MGDAEWRSETEWPLARTEYRPLYLHGEGNAGSLAGNGRVSLDPRPMNRPTASCTTRRTPSPPWVGVT